MATFFHELKSTNAPLFYFALLCLAASIVFLCLTRFTNMQVAGVNAWLKPFKLVLSISLYSGIFSWRTWYLPEFNTPLFSWPVIVLFGLVIVYIALQAARGQLSHFDVSNTFYTTLYGLMAAAAKALSIYTGYMGVLFLRNDFPNLSFYYVWSIRMAIVLFVIFHWNAL